MRYEDYDLRKLIDEIAAAQGVSYDTRYHWRVRGKVPHHWRLTIKEIAAMKGADIPNELFDDFTETRLGYR